jgi:acetylglutamate kinase
MQALHIIKIGGNVIDNSENLHRFLKDFTALDGHTRYWFMAAAK